ncbi:helix-turn-helix transcriptional regulator [Streptomyces sp. NPDC047315]|uniref:helix-turn-helix domain-containing protein n=1 Tax=Streptomyces sp. NPDC047315 TaxID=3155142 RepID=UPI0033EB05A0
MPPADPPPSWVLTRRQQIGARIRAARRGARLSQERLGEATGADRRTISRVEYGLTDPPLSLLLRIARALDVPLAQLVAGGEE